MKKKAALMGMLVLMALLVRFFVAKLITGNNNANDKQISASEFLTSIGSELPSPSGEYMLSLEPYDDGGVMSFKFAVTSNKERLVSEEFFRARDAFFSLWDDELDRVWVYSGDLGTFFWDICDGHLIAHSYVSSEGVNVPQALKKLKPGLYASNTN